jgi:hypothetical protein
VLLTVPAVERQVPMRVVGVAKESRAANAGAVAEGLAPCATGPICEPELGSELLLDRILPKVDGEVAHAPNHLTFSGQLDEPR